MVWGIIIPVIVVAVISVLVSKYNDSSSRKKKVAYSESLGSDAIEHKIGSRLYYFTKNKENLMSVCLANTDGVIVRNEAPFSITKIVELCLHNGFVAFDDKNKKVMFACDQDVTSHTHLEFKVVKYEDIISVQILEDGDAVFEKSTSRTIGGALIGGALMGGAGAVVGGLSGSSRKKKKVKSIKIKLILRKTRKPSFEFIIYNSDERKSDELKEYYQDAEKIKDTISVILDRIDREVAAESQKVFENQKLSSSNGSVADELTKLAALLEKGLLTEEEFERQKAKLLSLI